MLQCFQLAVSEKDELFSWGFNGHGRLGHKTTENELVPMRVLFFRPGYRFEGVKVSALLSSFKLKYFIEYLLIVIWKFFKLIDNGF